MATRTQVHLEATSTCAHEQVYRATYTQHWRRLQSLCLWMAPNVAQAQQLAREIMVAAWRQAAPEDWSALDGDHLIEALAHRFRDIFTNGAAQEPLRMIAGQPLRAALQHLSADLRLIYLLHDGEGYAAEKLALWLGMDREAVASRVHAARVQLRGMLRAA